MARQPSAILTPAQQKAVDTVSTLKSQLKTEGATLKDLNKAVGVATKAATKQQLVVDRIATKLAKFEKPAAVVVQTVAKAA